MYLAGACPVYEGPRQETRLKKERPVVATSPVEAGDWRPSETAGLSGDDRGRASQLPVTSRMNVAVQPTG